MYRSRLCFWCVSILCVALASCADAAQPNQNPQSEPTVTAIGSADGTGRTAQIAAWEAASGQQLGGVVTVLGVWEGNELDAFLEMVKPFQDVTGTSVLFEGTRDLNTVLNRRIRVGTPPDLAGLPGPAQIEELVRRGDLIDLNGVLDEPVFQGQYAPQWLDLGTVDGELGGIFIRASVKGLIWYNPEIWTAEGFTIPQTWDELLNRSQEIADSGSTPWCVGLESGPASGWPGTDWIENIVLGQQGAEFYDQWYRGEIAWTSQEIRRAWETWGEIVADREMVYGGRSVMLTMNFAEAGLVLFSEGRGCYMYHQASFITDFFVDQNPGVEPGEDYDFFRFPAFNSGSPEHLVVAGDLFGMFTDTPQARALMRYLVTPEAQAIWVEHGGAISPNTGVPLSAYPDPVMRSAAELIANPEDMRFDASDLMPRIMNNAFWQAVLDYVEAPQNLDDILQNLEVVRRDAYR